MRKISKKLMIGLGVTAGVALFATAVAVPAVINSQTTTKNVAVKTESLEAVSLNHQSQMMNRADLFSWGSITSWFHNTWNDVKTDVHHDIQKADATMDHLGQDIKQDVHQGVQDVKTAWTKATQDVKQDVKTAWTKVTQDIKQDVHQVIQKATVITTTVEQAIKSWNTTLANDIAIWLNKQNLSVKGTVFANAQVDVYKAIFVAKNFDLFAQALIDAELAKESYNEVFIHAVNVIDYGVLNAIQNEIQHLATFVKADFQGWSFQNNTLLFPVTIGVGATAGTSTTDVHITGFNPIPSTVNFDA